MGMNIGYGQKQVSIIKSRQSATQTVGPIAPFGNTSDITISSVDLTKSDFSAIVVSTPDGANVGTAELVSGTTIRVKNNGGDAKTFVISWQVIEYV
ncbi:MAG: hypothetical protein GY738_17270 [Pseudoalteromonas sp.]|nr:hypothetical protein [Pseudoalteromonas sp.]